MNLLRQTSPAETNYAPRFCRLSSPSSARTARPTKARRIPNACRAIGISRSMLYKLAGQGNVKLEV
jgi:hypothetical protein